MGMDWRLQQCHFSDSSSNRGSIGHAGSSRVSRYWKSRDIDHLTGSSVNNVPIALGRNPTIPGIFGHNG